MSTPIIVDFPLRGEWFAPNTPGTRIPSHGTDMLAQTYAYDFVGLEPGSRSMRFYRPNLLHYLFLGVRLEECFGWGQPIYAATAGTVVQAADGWPERNPVSLARDVSNLLKNAAFYNANQTDDLRPLTGNHIMVESADGYVLYAHLQNGSIKVAAGDKIIPGRHIANVGHSGNSTAPHLHFQIMDRLDPWKAKGIHCCFRDYEVLRNGAWLSVQNAIPTAKDRIRKL